MAQPLYQRVADALRAQITETSSDEPVRLPRERDLCRIHHVSHTTISKALEVLVREGLIERTRRRGTFTVPRAVPYDGHRRQGHTILLVTKEDLSQSASGFYDMVYQGICRRCKQLRYELSTCMDRDTARTMPIMDLPLPESHRGTIGVIFIGLMNEEMIGLYTGAGYPVVCLDYWPNDPRADAVVVDCYSEGQVATEFLLRQGHTQLFYMGHLLRHRYKDQEESDSELVLAGIQRALKLADLPPLPPERIRSYPNAVKQRKYALEWLLSLRPMPTSGVTFSAAMCEWLIQELPAHGIHCPEDISLVTKTYDGFVTDLASLRAPSRALGETAVDALLDRACGRRSRPMRLVMPSELVRGRSVRQLVQP